MRTGRPDLDAMLKVSSIPADEPVFVVRAQDAAGAVTVEAWASEAAALGAPAAVIEQALRHADAMRAWPVSKVADDGHLTATERAQLTYELERRAWQARDAIDGPEILLAERRGRSEANRQVYAALAADRDVDADAMADRLFASIRWGFRGDADQEAEIRTIVALAWAAGRRAALNPLVGRRTCRACGCWELAACDGGCAWSAEDVCSTCAPFVAPAEPPSPPPAVSASASPPPFAANADAEPARATG